MVCLILALQNWIGSSQSLVGSYSDGLSVFFGFRNFNKLRTQATVFNELLDLFEFDFSVELFSVINKVQFSARKVLVQCTL